MEESHGILYGSFPIEPNRPAYPGCPRTARRLPAKKKLPHDAASPRLPTTPRRRQPPHAVATCEPSDVETSSSQRPRCPGGVQAGGRAASKQRRRSDDPAAEAARCPGSVASRLRPSGGGRSSDLAAEVATQHPGAQVFVRHFAGEENHQFPVGQLCTESFPIKKICGLIEESRAILVGTVRGGRGSLLLDFFLLIWVGS